VQPQLNKITLIYSLRDLDVPLLSYNNESLYKCVATFDIELDEETIVFASLSNWSSTNYSIEYDRSNNKE
jgi:hypothetical protein